MVRLYHGIDRRCVGLGPHARRSETRVPKHCPDIRRTRDQPCLTPLVEVRRPVDSGFIHDVWRET